MSPAEHAVLSAKLDAVREHQHRQDQKLDSIERHVKATNGRVMSLELWRARIEGVRAGVSWVSVALGSVLTGTVTGVLVYVLTH